MRPPFNLVRCCSSSTTRLEPKQKNVWDPFSSINCGRAGPSYNKTTRRETELSALTGRHRLYTIRNAYILLIFFLITPPPLFFSLIGRFQVWRGGWRSSIPNACIFWAFDLLHFYLYWFHPNANNKNVTVWQVNERHDFNRAAIPDIRMRKKFLSFFVLYTRPVYFVPDLLPRTSIFCSGKKLYQSYMPTGSLQQDKPESLVIYPWRETHTHTQERGKGGELKRRLGNKKQQAKNWAFTNSLFVCVCFTPSTLQMWKKNTGTKKVESFERGLQGTYTHTQPENEGNREGKTTYPCRPHQVLRCPPIFSAFSLMQRSFVCVRTHHHAAHCCPATEAKVNSSNCKRGKQNKKGGDLRNELSVIRMRAIWNFEIGNTSPPFFFFFMSSSPSILDSYTYTDGVVVALLLFYISIV